MSLVKTFTNEELIALEGYLPGCTAEITDRCLAPESGWSNGALCKRHRLFETVKILIAGEKAT
ncbi:hypothetical protein LCGC14_0252200 [marine sediment metagenome]|uniref:Uncharacterized protein n=1 Tax=marine sediment metagenome TaxID=412755 RepID=A0A0F9X948_9ZZZZ